MLLCFICSVKFESFNELQIHVRRTHDLLGFERLTCSQNGCPRVFGSVYNLYRHIKSQHVSDLSKNKSYNNSKKQSISDNEEELSCTAASELNEIELNPVVSNVDVKSSELSFVLKLCSMPNLNRTDITRVLEHTSTLLSVKCPDKETHFEGLTSDYLIKKRLLDEYLFIANNDILLGYESDDNVKVNMHNELVQRPVYGQYVNIKDILMNIFKREDLLHIALNYMRNKSETGELHDLKDGSKLKNLPENSLPFILFYDELELGNALGSHKGINKVGIIQLSLRCFPTHYYSKLKNIFICVVFPTTDREYLKVVIEKLVHELSYLTNTRILLHNLFINFCFAGITGDNLGLNQILGFVESFQAIYFCRLCKIHRDSSKSALDEDSSLIRNEHNYDEDVLRNDISSTGIKFDSLLNKIPNYHVTDNCFLDVMHDVLEGIGKFGMIAIIEYYVSNKIFSLQTLNSRIRLFNFGHLSNKPPTITKQMIMNGDLSYSAAETSNLILYFSLIIGDLVNETCIVWDYYITTTMLLLVFHISCNFFFSISL